VVLPAPDGAENMINLPESILIKYLIIVL